MAVATCTSREDFSRPGARGSRTGCCSQLKRNLPIGSRSPGERITYEGIEYEASLSHDRKGELERDREFSHNLLGGTLPFGDRDANGKNAQKEIIRRLTGGRIDSTFSGSQKIGL
jgi:hypothetical protein